MMTIPMWVMVLGFTPYIAAKRTINRKLYDRQKIHVRTFCLWGRIDPDSLVKRGLL